MDFIKALQKLEKLAEQNTSLEEFCGTAGQLAQMFQQSTKNNRVRKPLNELRSNISRICTLLENPLLSPASGECVYQSCVGHIASLDDALKTLVSAMEGDLEDQSNSAQEYPLTMFTDDALSSPESELSTILRTVKVAHNDIHRILNPKDYQIDGKFTVRANGMVCHTTGDIGSGNRGPALHDYSRSVFQCTGNVGSRNDTRGTEGNLNLARDANITARSLLSHNQGNLGDLNLNGTHAVAQDVVSGAVNIEELVRAAAARAR
jgi:hypothetical protein